MLSMVRDEGMTDSPPRGLSTAGDTWHWSSTTPPTELTLPEPPALF
jgi:hypothetical protein